MNPQLKVCFQFLLCLWLGQVLKDVAEGSSPNPATAASSISDANLMFEILLGGVEINQDNNVLLLDEGLASMRKGREFLSQINDGIPKRLSSLELMSQTMGTSQKTPLTQHQFKNLVLSMVYSALQVRVENSQEEREAWGGVLMQLANITTYDLRGSFLFRYT